jgi:hypothetical protein
VRVSRAGKLDRLPEAGRARDAHAVIAQVLHVHFPLVARRFDQEDVELEA